MSDDIDDQLDEEEEPGDLEGPEDLDEDDLEDLEDDDGLDEIDVEVDEEGGDEGEVGEEEDEEGAGARTETEEDEEEDEDELLDEDVEASLDVILKERLVVQEEEDEDEEVAEPEDRSEGATKVLPKQPDEFVCQSCFLVKHPSQLADAGRMYCRDCV